MSHFLGRNFVLFSNFVKKKIKGYISSFSTKKVYFCSWYSKWAFPLLLWSFYKKMLVFFKKPAFFKKLFFIFSKKTWFFIGFLLVFLKKPVGFFLRKTKLIPVGRVPPRSRKLVWSMFLSSSKWNRLKNIRTLCHWGSSAESAHTRFVRYWKQPFWCNF